MASDELRWLSATDLAALIRRRKLSPVEVIDDVLGRIDRLNPQINAYVTVTHDEARRAARAAERALRQRQAALGPLHGVPFSVKDLAITKGVRTTFGTRLFADNVPTEDAPMVARLRAAGAIMVGKTNTPTLGWLGATHNLLFGATRNPWRLDRTPGGSSGGASAAVAAGLAPIAVGSDGGGSIRIPASFAGIFGHKPSYGRIPIYPSSATWSLSHIGPMTRTVGDAALAMQVCAGPDDRDPCSLPRDGTNYVRAIREGVKGLRIAYAEDLGNLTALDPEVRQAAGRAARAFRELGSRVDPLAPRWPSPGETWAEIFWSGVATRLLPYRERFDEIEPGLRALVEAAYDRPASRYVQAWHDWLAWWQHPRTLFERYDLLLTPTVSCPAFPVGLDHPGTVAGKAVPGYAWLPYTYPFNLTGQPAASVPCGFTRDGLPIGLQIVGRRFDDATVLRAAAAFERARPWENARPGL